MASGHRRKVFVDDMDFFTFPVLLFFVLTGHRVFVFDFSCRLREYPAIRFLLRRSLIERVYITPNSHEHGEAIELTEQIFAQIERPALFSAIEGLFGSAEIVAVFKKTVLTDLFRFVFIRSYLHREHEHAPSEGNTAVMIPSVRLADLSERFVRRYAKGITLCPDGVLLIRAPLLLTKASSWWHSVYILLHTAGFLLRGVIRALKAARSAGIAEPIHTRFIIAIHCYADCVNAGDRSVSMFIDNALLTSRNTVVLSHLPLPGNVRALFKAQGIPLYYSYELGSRRFPFKTLSRFIRANLFDLCALSCRFPRAFPEAVLTCLHTYALGDSITQHLSARHYLYTGNESAHQNALNIMFKRAGMSTWYYTIHLGGGYLSSPALSALRSTRHILWAYLTAEHVICTNHTMREYHRQHYQQVSAYHPLGMLFAEQICRKKDENIKKQVIQRYFPAHDLTDTPLVVFFDTTFIDDQQALTNYDDALRFYRDILHLADTGKDLLIIIKPSKDPSWFLSERAQFADQAGGALITKVWDELRARSCVAFALPPETAETFVNFAPNNELIAAADVTVTHCMSSPTAEALAARKKAFWYESGEKHRNVLYDRIPGLLCHGRDALIERLAELLYHTSTDHYDRYLDTHIKGEIDPFLDGNALTRTRTLMAQT